MKVELSADEIGYLRELMKSDKRRYESLIKEKEGLLETQKDKPLIHNKYTHDVFRNVNKVHRELVKEIDNILQKLAE